MLWPAGGEREPCCLHLHSPGEGSKKMQNLNWALKKGNIWGCESPRTWSSSFCSLLFTGYGTCLLCMHPILTIMVKDTHFLKYIKMVTWSFFPSRMQTTGNHDVSTLETGEGRFYRGKLLTLKKKKKEPGSHSFLKLTCTHDVQASIFFFWWSLPFKKS